MPPNQLKSSTELNNVELIMCFSCYINGFSMFLVRLFALCFSQHHTILACMDVFWCPRIRKQGVENFVLLKCRNSEEKTRRLRIRSSAEFLYSMTCVVICSHRRSHLSHFYRVSYRYFWRRDS